MRAAPSCACARLAPCRRRRRRLIARCDSQASDPKVFWDSEQRAWVLLYFCNGAGTRGGAAICVAFSDDQAVWLKARALRAAKCGAAIGRAGGGAAVLPRWAPARVRRDARAQGVAHERWRGHAVRAAGARAMGALLN